MPLTPLHLAAAAPAKAMLKSQFSVKLFFAVQCVIDLEPITFALLGADQLHGPWHTWARKSVAGWTCGTGLARPVWNEVWRVYVDPLSWPVMLGTAFYGAWTHVALDGFMHADVPVWRSHSWANTEVLNELLVAMVIAGAGLAAVTYGFPWIVRIMAQQVRGLLERLK